MKKVRRDEREEVFPLITFKPLTPQKAYEHVAEQIQEHILNKHLLKGEKLPGERELAEQFKVSRIVIREALRTVSATGLIEVRHGVGSFVKQDFPGLLSRSLKLFLVTKKTSLLNLLEIRKILEVHASILACRNATPRDLTVLRRQIEKMKRKASSGKGWKEGEDFDFHLAIAYASKNHFLAVILDAILDLSKEGRYATLGLVGDANYYFVEHNAMYEAIKTKDENKISRIMERHFEEAAEDIVKAKKREQGK